MNKNVKSRSCICVICACKEEGIRNDFYCSYWDKRCNLLEHRKQCPGFIHKDSFDNVKTIEQMIKEYDDEIKEEGEP